MRCLLLFAVLLALTACGSAPVVPAMRDCGVVTSGDPGTLRGGADAIERCEQDNRTAQAQYEISVRMATQQAIQAAWTPTPLPTFTPTATMIPTDTPAPTMTPTATSTPTNTPEPTSTATDTPAPVVVASTSSERVSSVPPLLLLVAAIAVIAGLVLLAPTISKWWRETSK